MLAVYRASMGYNAGVTSLRFLALASLFGLALACAKPLPTLHRIDPAAAAGAGEPNLVAGDDGKLYLSWIEPADDGHALRFSILEGEQWSEPRTIAEGDHWFVNWADFPSMAAAADGTLAAHWLAKSAPDTYAYDVVLALSQDGGSSWSAPFSPHDDGTPTEHGFVSMVPREDWSFTLLWLDGREMVEGGSMTLRSATVDRDGKVTDGALVDPRVCDCCSTDAAPTDAGLLALFRDRSDEEVRDISSARLEADGWSEIRALHDDGWTIAACPVNGPALDARGMRAAAAWFTAPGNTPRVNFAFSEDGGASFGAPLRIDTGEAIGRVDVELLDDGSALVSWLERGTIFVRRVRPEGGASEPVAIAATGESRAGGFPRMALAGGRLFVAWTEPGSADDPSYVRAAWLEPPD
jgi:hypothetical protein